MGRKQAQPSQRIDTAGGTYLGFPSAMFDSPAWKHGADFRMQAIVQAVARHWNGFNNGSIGVSARQIAEAIGSANHNANAKALQRAVDRGLLVCTRVYPKGMRKAREYRLPWASTGKHPKFEAATHDYKLWSPEDESERNNRRSFILPVATTATDLLRPPQQGKEQTVATTATLEAVLDPSPVATTATPLSIPSPHLSLISDENSGGVFQRPASMTTDDWIIAQRRAKANPSTPDAEFCRSLATAFLEGTPRGSQSKLAKVAGIPDASFSKFLHRDGPLSPHHRSALVATIVATGFQLRAA